MADLSTEYLGLKLKNPLIVASCSLSKNLDGIQRIEEGGAGAVVLKSLFEEQIQKEMVEDIEQFIGPSWHSEAFDYVNKMGMELGPREYLKLIEGAKKSIRIPIIASLNCVSTGWWKDYAKQIESAGADALEMNVALLPHDVKKSSTDIENLYYKVVEKVRETIGIPVAVKIGPFFTSLTQFANELAKRGAMALVLFNRFYQFDIDIEHREVIGANYLSTAGEMSLPLRWISLLYGEIECGLSATTGIHNTEGVMKLIFAGAQAVQLCSVLYKKGVEYVGTILKEAEGWLDKHGIKNLDEIRGTLSRSASENPELYERIQYIKALVGIE
jgi:dihydroorotate dehydrogenase (fumarate)